MPRDPHIWEIRVTLEANELDQFTELVRSVLRLQRAGVQVDVFPVHHVEIEEITPFHTPRPKSDNRPRPLGETNENTQVIADVPTFNGTRPSPTFKPRR